MHHSIPDDKKAGKSSKASSSSSKTDPSVSLLLPARPPNSEKVYKPSTNYADDATSAIAAQLEQSILDDVTAGKPVVHYGSGDSVQIAKNLVLSHLDDMAAVNERNWSTDGPLFRNKASYWEADLPSSAAPAGQKTTCAGFVAIMQKITTLHPDYKVKAIDFHTNVDERTGRAEVYANVETSGFFDGVVQRNVTLCEYHLIEGEWFHVAHRTMQGMDGMRMPFQG